MRKNLRMLCMAVAAVAFTSGFAQTDMTDKVMNADMEKGVLGWDIDFTSTVWKKQTKNQATYPGYHGFHNFMLECWHGDLTKGIGNSTLSQTLTDLPNGTYVFGVYAAAAHTVSSITSPNKEEVYGVNLFANEQSVPMATNPVEAMFVKWGHTSKFNVAVKVTDGTLKFGVKVEDTFINFVGIDEASLWYFDDMDPEAALDKMAEIDMAKVIAIADTCVDNKMNADTLAHLNEMIEAAKKVTKNSELYQADEDLYWAIYLANKSAKEYITFANAIAAAKVVAAMEWSTVEETIEAVEALKALISECEGYYESGAVISAEIAALVEGLAEAVAIVELDGVYTSLETYEALVDSIGDLTGDEVGQYSDEMVEQAKSLLDVIYEELNAVGGDISAAEIKVNCEKNFAKIQEIADNPIDYSEFPIWIYEGDELLPNQGSGTNNQAYPVLAGSYLINYPAGTDKNGNSYGERNNCAAFKSPLYRFREPLKSVRFIVHKSGMETQVDALGNANICIGSFAMFDERGDEIPLSENDVYANCNETLPGQSGGIPALLDGNPGTYFHSLWSAGTPQEHYIEVTLPSGAYSAFSFMMVAYSSNHTRAFPRELEITYVSETVTEMQEAMVAARELYPVFGTDPGFNNMDLTPFMTALAEADELVLQAKQDASSVDDDYVSQLTNRIDAEADKIRNTGVKMPEPDKKYRIISSEKSFVNNQNVQKAMTIHTGDTVKTNWLWWEDACPDSLDQEFSFEFIGEANDKVYYAIKHVATQMYLADWKDADGYKDVNNAVFTLAETPDSFELRGLGNGEFAIGREGYAGTYMHALNHNSGVADSTAAAQAGVGKGKGLSSSIITWVNSAYDYSGWSIREMSQLPEATKSFSDFVFQSKTYTLYHNVNILTLTANAACAFENLVISDNTGQEQVITSMEVEDNKATVVLEASIASFSFSFDKTEGVTKVEVDGSLVVANNGPSAEFTKLQNSYNAALTKAPVQGEGVGQVSDLSEYDAAVAAAQLLLEAEEEADAETLVAAANAVDSAMAHLKINYPVAGKNYYIILGGFDFKKNFNTDMAIYTRLDATTMKDAAYWAYVNVRNTNFLWQFEDCGQLLGGDPAYYLKNVGTGLYMGPTLDRSHKFLVDDTAETQPYIIKSVNGGKVVVGDNSTVSDGYVYLHPNGHSQGSGINGTLISWSATDVGSAMRVVEAEQYLADYLNAVGIEDIEIADEYVAPAVKGIYDLFGRRIETPAATGIYIVDGKKRVIKK